MVVGVPDGIREMRSEGRLRDGFVTPLSVLLLGGCLLAACLGVAGGRASPLEATRFDDTTITVKTPTVIRNGEFFETDIWISSKSGIDKPVLGVGSKLWRDMTVNTMIPAAVEEEYRGGEFRFSYGRLAPGETLHVKIDGQINPPLFAGNEGTLSLHDGERLIGRRHLSIRVLP